MFISFSRDSKTLSIPYVSQTSEYLSKKSFEGIPNRKTFSLEI